jgi:hypothetical protein
MNYDFQNWLNKRFDKNLTIKKIIDYQYENTLKTLDNLGLNIFDEESFFREFVLFVYSNSQKSKKQIQKQILTERRDEFEFNFQNDLINLYYHIEEDCLRTGVKIFNQGQISDFIDLIFSNVEFELDEDLSEEEYSENEFYE